MRSPRSDTHLVNKDDILALLEDGPKESGMLARWLTLPQARLIAACQELQHAGIITRLPFPDRRWALPGHAPIFVTATPPRAAERAPAARRAPLREAPPAAAVVTKDTPPSWWVGLSRAELNAAAHAKAHRMSATRLASKVTSYIND